MRDSMTKIDRSTLVRRRDPHTNRLEAYEARSACGRWHYRRDVDARWVVTHIPTGRQVDFPSLVKARRATAYGDAVAQQLFGVSK